MSRIPDDYRKAKLAPTLARSGTGTDRANAHDLPVTAAGPLAHSPHLPWHNRCNRQSQRGEVAKTCNEAQ
jgi:hypothetical protein